MKMDIRTPAAIELDIFFDMIDDTVWFVPAVIFSHDDDVMLCHTILGKTCLDMPSTQNHQLEQNKNNKNAFKEM